MNNRSEALVISFRTLTFVCLALVPGLVLLVGIWTSVEADGISTVTRKLPTVDFTNIWAGGTLAREGGLDDLFDANRYRAWLRERFSPRYEDSEWSYPPTVLLLGVPLSLLGIVPAYLVWVAGSAALLYGVLRAAGLPAKIGLLSLFSPAMLQSVIFGQNGALTAALLCGALLLTGSRPYAAGVAAGLLTIKPQLGILLPVAYLAGRAWRSMLVAGLIALAAAVAATIGFGSEVWVHFWTITRPSMIAVMEAGWPSEHLTNGTTVFFAVRTQGLGLQTAYACQALATLGALFFTSKVWRMKDADPALRMAVTVPLALLATPYAYTYDQVAVAVATSVIVARKGLRFGPLEALIWIWPGVSIFLGLRGWLVTPLLLVAAAVLAWRELRLGPRQGDATSHPSNPR